MEKEDDTIMRKEDLASLINGRKYILSRIQPHLF